MQVSIENVVDLTKLVGEIQGTLNTTPTGGVGYSIPIYCSPGTNNIQPSISLIYNSQSNEGIAGVGWNISGLSLISRTGKNLYHNQKVSAVSFTTEDLFLLDGTKLNPSNGQNGADGTIYSCEAENFSKIISNNYSSSNSTSPLWFKVIANDGTITEYGNTYDSRMYTNDFLNIMFWRVNKITDVNGNYIEFKYEIVGRDNRIKEILYTGNTNTGLEAYNSILFEYINRGDANTSYDAGSSVSNISLLKAIIVKHKADNLVENTIRKYILNHTFNNSSTKLASIAEYAGDETAPSLNNTTFNYGNPNVPNLTIHPSCSINGTEDLFSGDFDGDGKTDILAAAFYYSNFAKIYTGYSVNTNFNDVCAATYMYGSNFTSDGVMNAYMNADIGGLFTADYNKDGRDDVIYLSGRVVEEGQSLLLYNVVLKTSGSFNPQTGFYEIGTRTFSFPGSSTTDGYYQLTSASGRNFITGDYDGDGNQDYILIARNNSNNNYKAFFTSLATNEVNYEIQDFGIGEGTNAFTVSQADRIVPIDFDGDGKTELLVVKDNQYFILTFNRLNTNPNNTITTSILLISNTINKNCRLWTGDFNSDKKTDLLVHYDNNTWGILYSNGLTYDANAEAFVFNKPVSFNGFNISYDNKILIGDFNGDGKSDILHGYADYVYATQTFYNKLALYYSKGKGSGFQFELNNSSTHLTFGDIPVGDFNGDGKADFVSSTLNDVKTMHLKPYGQENLLTNITTGHNVNTAIQYKTLADTRSYPWIYERTISQDHALNTNPFNYTQAPIHVLHKSVVADGIGGDNITEFFYEDALVHRYAKGLLGFTKIKSINNVTGITSISENDFNRQFAISYSTKQSKKITATNFLLSETYNQTSFVDLTTNGVKSFLQHFNTSTTFDYLNGKAVATENTYDAFGNITTQISKNGYGTYGNFTAVEIVQTTTTFGIHNSNVPSKPENINTQNTRVGKPTLTKTVSFTYDALGRLLFHIDFVGTTKAIINTNTFNSFGNVASTSKSVSNLPSITINNTFDTKGRFVLQKQTIGGNVSHTESFIYDTKWGVPLTTTSSDCLNTQFEYDAFGRLNKTILPNGNLVTLTNTWQINNDKLFYSTEHSSGGSPDKRKYFDKWGKLWKEEVASMESIDPDEPNLWHTKLTTYDSRGNLKTKSNAYFPMSETPRFTTYYYDAFNRTTQANSYAGYMYFAYNAEPMGRLKVTTTNIDGNTTSETTDASNKVVSASDNGGSIQFDYNSIGNQIEVNTNGNIVVQSVYDIYGMQTSITDINAGTTQYSYDNFNRVINQIDAKSNNTVFTYDGLGRLLTRASTEDTTTYEYYKNMAVGCSNDKLKKVIGFNGITKDYSYDNLNRLISVIETNVPGSIASRTTNYLYTINSELSATIYPNNIRVYNFYDANGYLISKSTSKFNAPASKLFYDPVLDGEGRYKSYKLGNGKTTFKTYNNDFPASTTTVGVQNLNYNFQASTGNLLSRSDNIHSQTETFVYDNLNRLNTSMVNGTIQNAVTFDGTGSVSMGNIATKTDAGYYTYMNTKKNAVAFITNTAVNNQTPVTPTPSTVITQTEQLITYNSFLKPESINDGGPYGGPTIYFEYGPDFERIQTITHLGRSPSERRYFASDYEEQEKGATINRGIVYVTAGEGLVCMIVKENDAITRVGENYFVYTHYLGSILTVTNNVGSIVASNNYDAWGRERNPTNWSQVLPPLSISATNPFWLYRGFTGHEMLSNFSLINMNARLYDPIIGRMVSPDNYVQAPLNSQNYNRYTYCLNNPLKYTDPTGNLFVIDSWIGGFIKGLATGSNAWREANKTARNDLKIWGGLFATNPNKTFGGKVWQIFSRFTWQLPQTGLGFAFSQLRNTFGAVESVNYKYGATVIRGEGRGVLFGGGGGLTLGSYINGNNTIRAESNNALFQHEYGHVLQSEQSGIFYLSKYGFPSLFSKDPYNSHPADQDANARALKFFNNTENNYSGWRFAENSIDGYDRNQNFNSSQNQRAVNNAISKLHWYEIGVSVLLPTATAIYNIFNQRSKY